MTEPIVVVPPPTTVTGPLEVSASTDRVLPAVILMPPSPVAIPLTLAPAIVVRLYPPAVEAVCVDSSRAQTIYISITVTAVSKPVLTEKFVALICTGAPSAPMSPPKVWTLTVFASRIPEPVIVPPGALLDTVRLVRPGSPGPLKRRLLAQSTEILPLPFASDCKI